MENNDQFTEIKVKKENVLKAYNIANKVGNLNFAGLLCDLFPEAFEESKQEEKKESGAYNLIQKVYFTNRPPNAYVSTSILDDFKKQFIELAKKKINKTSSSFANPYILIMDAEKQLDEM